MSAAGTSVTLCCAEDDEPNLASVVDHLQAEGFDPKVLPGVDKDPYVLGVAVDGERGKHIFVVCRSPNLSGSDVLRLEGIFGARKGPAHRLVGGRLNPDNPLEMVKTIRAAVSGFSSPDAGPEPSAAASASADRGSMRDVVAVTGISAVGSDARASEPIERRMSSRETPADPLAVPLTGRAGEHAARVPPHQSGGWQVKAKIEDTLSEQKAPLQADSESPIPPASLLPEPRARSSSSRLMPALLVGILVAVVGVGIILALGGSDDPGPQSPARVATAGQQAAVDPPQPKPTPPQPQPQPQPTPVSNETGAEQGGDDGSEPALEGDNEAQAISEAIATGEMRAIDNTLVLKPGGTRNWREASNYCKRKRVREVGGWRLPSMQELKTLRSARMLKRGIRYWSGTGTSQGSDEVYVLDHGTRKVEIVHKESEDVEVLCVRLR
jgi:hypothetical protein